MTAAQEDAGDQTSAGSGVKKIGLAGAGAAVSFSALSPPEQGDAVSGLTLAVAGVGPALPDHLPSGADPGPVGEQDAWAVATAAETGWYVLLSQDCDIVRTPEDEPTVSVAPLLLVDSATWRELRRGGYSSRRYAYPGEKFDLPPDTGLVVDLAWTTSVVKGSLTASRVAAVRSLTGPAKAAFGEWCAARTGRVPFPDDVVVKVLDPCYEVRARLSRAFDKAAAKGTPSLDARTLVAVERWFAHRDGMLVTVLGQVTPASLHRGGFLNEDNQVLTEDLEKGRARLEAAAVKKMERVDEHSGYRISIKIADLATLPASDFVRFALLLR
jgi:hypothetical protein